VTGHVPVPDSHSDSGKNHTSQQQQQGLVALFSKYAVGEGVQVHGDFVAAVRRAACCPESMRIPSSGDEDVPLNGAAHEGLTSGGT